MSLGRGSPSARLHLRTASVYLNAANEVHVGSADCSSPTAIWFCENADDLIDNWCFAFPDVCVQSPNGRFENISLSNAGTHPKGAHIVDVPFTTSKVF